MKTQRFPGQGGYSLMEIMIIVGIGGVVALASSRLMMDMIKRVKTAQQRSDISNLIGRINQELLDKANCSATMYGVSGVTSSTTFISSIKQLDDHGRIESHPFLKVTPSNSMGSSIATITGMYVKHISNHSNGGNYELWVTVTKSRKNNATSYGENAVSYMIPVQLDNCNRYVVVAPQNSPTSNPLDSRMLCSSAGGTPFGKPLVLNNSGESAPNIFMFQGCRVCGVSRVQVTGCI